MHSRRRLRLSGCTKSSSDCPSNSSGARGPAEPRGRGVEKGDAEFPADEDAVRRLLDQIRQVIARASLQSYRPALASTPRTSRRIAETADSRESAGLADSPWPSSRSRLRACSPCRPSFLPCLTMPARRVRMVSTSARNCHTSSLVESGPWPGITVSKSSVEHAVERFRPVEETAALRVVHVDVHTGRLRGRRGCAVRPCSAARGGPGNRSPVWMTFEIGKVDRPRRRSCGRGRSTSPGLPCRRGTPTLRPRT